MEGGCYLELPDGTRVRADEHGKPLPPPAATPAPAVAPKPAQTPAPKPEEVKP